MIMHVITLLAAVVSLNGEWDLRWFNQPDEGAVRTLSAIPADARSVKATVPGNCELDLVREGILPPVEIGLNASLLRPYEGCQWLYAKSFDRPSVPVGGRVILQLAGVDTLADVFLNGEKIGECENMLIAHRFDVTKRLKDKDNILHILIRSVMCEAQNATIGELGGSMYGGKDGEPFRKAGFMGGWDIFPRAFVSGLWRDVTLEVEGRVTVDQPQWMVKSLGKTNAQLYVACRIRCPHRMLDKMTVRWTLSRNGKVFQTEQVVKSHFPIAAYWNVAGIEKWWPKGMGEPALYDATAEVLDEQGNVLATHMSKFGFRTVELVREDVYSDERPGQFLFKVNGEPCYVRGSNWVPLDSFPSRQEEQIIPTLEMWEDLNCNMVRVWGGGVYEPDAFYDWCDEHGIMVWQDFMTGCSVFPQDDKYARLTREEVLETVLRLRNRPSLVLWSGNNENDGAFQWKLGHDLGPDPNRDRNSRRTIPEVLYEFDVSRPYLPSSPYYSHDVFSGIAKPSEEHLWGKREYYKVPFYTNAPCWFASEMGYHGCPSRSSLEKMMTKGKVYPWTKVENSGKDPMRDFKWNDEWLFKASDWRGKIGHRRNSRMTNQVKLMFGDVPTELDDFILASQIVQAEAMKTFVELFRSQKFTKKNGLIWWNVRDGWPQISDAVVDYYGGKKRAYYAIRNAQFNQLVMVRDDHKVVAVNDTLKPVAGEVTVTDRESGRVVFASTYEVPSNAAKELGLVDWSGQGVLDIVYEQGGESHTNWFLYGEPPFDFGKMRMWMNCQMARHD